MIRCDGRGIQCTPKKGKKGEQDRGRWTAQEGTEANRGTEANEKHGSKCDPSRDSTQRRFCLASLKGRSELRSGAEPCCLSSERYIQVCTRLSWRSWRRSGDGHAALSRSGGGEAGCASALAVPRKSDTRRLPVTEHRATLNQKNRAAASMTASEWTRQSTISQTRSLSFLSLSVLSLRSFRRPPDSTSHAADSQWLEQSSPEPSARHVQPYLSAGAPPVWPSSVLPLTPPQGDP